MRNRTGNPGKAHKEDGHPSGVLSVCIFVGVRRKRILLLFLLQPSSTPHICCQKTAIRRAAGLVVAVQCMGAWPYDVWLRPFGCPLQLHQKSTL